MPRPDPARLFPKGAWIGFALLGLAVTAAHGAESAAPEAAAETTLLAEASEIPGEPLPFEITGIGARLAGDSLAAVWSTSGLFDDSARRALESGVGAQIRFAAEAWKIRRFWFNGVAASRSMRWLAERDRRGRRFVLIGGGTIRGFETVADLESFFSYPMNEGLAAVSDLSPGSKYFVTVKVEVTPLTLEAIQSVEYWMRGGDGGAGGSGLPGSGITRRLFGIVSDLSGFGDRVAGARTPTFALSDLSAGAVAPPAEP